MSTANFVPPTAGAEDGGVREALAKSSTGRLLMDAFIRFRYADGFSFARSMAFQIVLALIPGLIFVVALAVRIGEGRLQSMLREAVTTLAPGPAGQTLLIAFQQGSDAGRANLVAMLAGGSAAVFSAVAAMAQLQRGSSRIYGVLGDRKTAYRYGLATVLTLTTGLLLAGAFLLIVFGSGFGGELQDDLIATWAWARWPIGIAALVLGLAGLFKKAPNRRQASFGWLALGGSIAGLGWLVVSIGLSLFLNASTTFGQTYGPLAGFIGVMLWAFLSSIVVFYGLAVAAQLEAVRAGVLSPTEDRTPDENGKAA
jgi:YihY family inner membrane protein